MTRQMALQGKDALIGYEHYEQIWHSNFLYHCMGSHGDRGNQVLMPSMHLVTFCTTLLQLAKFKNTRENRKKRNSTRASPCLNCKATQRK